MKKKAALLAVLVFALVAFCGAASATEKASYMEVTPTEAKALIDKTSDIVIIDVSPAFANGHLPKAVNYYIGDGTFAKTIPTLNRDRTYIVYCHLSSTSARGAQQLVDASFPRVYRLKGNYKAWIQAGYPVEK